MARKYLNDFWADDTLERLNPEDPRWDRWKEEIEKFGFASYETWDMDLQFYGWLYERLRMFIEVNDIDLDQKIIKIRDTEIGTLKELIDKMVYGCELLLLQEFRGANLNDEQKTAVENVPYLWAAVIQHMWW